jgi:hypothetical protein
MRSVIQCRTKTASRDARREAEVEEPAMSLDRRELPELARPGGEVPGALEPAWSATRRRWDAVRSTDTDYDRGTGADRERWRIVNAAPCLGLQIGR